MQTKGPYRPNADSKRKKLSGGEWLNGNYKANDNLFAEYEITVPVAGKYNFYVRKFWQHGPFQYRFDDGEWVRIDKMLKELDSEKMEESVPLCWYNAGLIRLGAGRHTLSIELLNVPGYRFDTAYGFDCFILYDGADTPVGKAGLRKAEAQPTDSATSKDDGKTANQRQPKVSSGFEGNVIPQDSGILTIKPAQPELVLDGTAVLCDETGQQLASENIAKGAYQFTLPLPGPGFYSLTLQIRYSDGVTAKTQTTAAVIGSALADGARKSSKFGMCLVNMPEKLAINMGARWNWTFASLANYTQGPDGTPQAPAGQSGNGATASLMSQHVAFGYALPKYLAAKGEKEDIYPPANWEQLQELAKKWAQDYANRYEVITVYNEPDAKWKGSDEDLVKFHTVIAAGIKEVAPKKQVCGPGLYSLRVPYIKKLISLGLLEKLDGLTVHPYVDGTPPEADFIGRVIELKDYLKSIGKENLPVHFTEFGWTTQAGTWQKPVDELTQARYAVRSLALLSSTGITSALYFCGAFKCENPGEYSFSVCNRDFSPKPACPALAKALKTLAVLGTGGRWLKPAPETHLVAHKTTGGGSLIIAWTSGSAQRQITIPERIVGLTDMMGRVLPSPRPGETLTLTPSPLYIECAGSFLNDLELRPETQTSVGSTLDLPEGSTDIQAPLPFTVEGNKLTIPANCELGTYLVFLKKSGKAQAWGIEVSEPLAIKRPRLTWPADSPVALLNFECRALVAIADGGRAVYASNGIADSEAPLPTMLPGKRETVQIPLTKVPLGAKVTGELKLEFTGGGKHVVSALPYQVTLVPCALVKPGDSSLEGIATFNSSTWTSFGAKEVNASTRLSEADCSASARLGYNADGVVLRVDVTDNEHKQRFPAEQLWAGDSLQIAFDVDADKPWQENNLGFAGFNGHRFFEYGVALDEDGTVKTWRWLSYGPKLKANTADTGLKAKMRRKGTITQYEIVFPWSSLGLEGATKPGSSFGFALLINDLDIEADHPGANRHGLALFNGILTGKDPRDFGKIWFR